MRQLYGEQKPDKARPYRYTGAFFWTQTALCTTSVGLVLWVCVPTIIISIETARNSSPEMQMMDIGAVAMVILGMFVMSSVPLLMAVVMLIPCWRHRGEVITVSDNDISVTTNTSATAFPIELFTGVIPVTHSNRKAKDAFGDVTYTLTDARVFTIHSCHLHKTELQTDIHKRVFKHAAPSGDRDV